MPDVSNAIFGSWSITFGPTFALTLTALLYVRGWFKLRSLAPRRFDGWHLPAPYELTLHSDAWHEVEHICFLLSALLFWWPVVQPWPSRPQWPRWTMIPYLLLADIQNTALSAFLSFSDRVLYPTYESVPHFAGMTALNDHNIAGAIMLVPGSIAYLLPAAVIAARYLSPRRVGMAVKRIPPQSVRP